MLVGSLRPAVVALWLVVLTNGPLFFVSRRVFGLPGGWDDPIVQPAILLTVGTAVAFVLLDRQRLSGERLRPVARVPLAAAVSLGGWAALSTVWSLQPDITLWRGLVYVALPFVAWVIADLGADRFGDALGWSMGLIVATSLALVVLWPDAALDRNDDWRGIMTGRNSFAPLAALAVFAGVAWFARGARVKGGVLVAGSLVALLGSGSRTAWFALVIALGAATVLTVARWRYRRSPDRWVVVAAVITVVGGAGVAVAGIGRYWNESTLVQRRTIWDLVSDHIRDDPFLGKGWEAFWHTPALHTDELLTRGSAHGTVFELLLGVGVLGLLLWLVVAGTAVVGVGLRLWHEPDVEAWLWAAVVTFLLVENLTESFVLWFSYNWVLLTAAALRFGIGWRRPRAVRSESPSAAVNA